MLFPFAKLIKEKCRNPFALAALSLLVATSSFAQQDNPPRAPQPPDVTGDVQVEPAATDESLSFREENYQPQRIVIGGKSVVKTNEVVGELIVIGGSAEVHGRAREVVIVGGSLIVTGEVDHEATVVVGNADINGKINRDLNVIMGKGQFGPKAKIGRNSFLLGGPFNRDAAADIDPGVSEINAAPLVALFDSLKEWVIHGLLYGRLLVPSLTWNWVFAGVALLFYLLLTTMFPQAARGVVTSLETKPLSSIFVGMLTSILFLPLVVLLAMLVIPIPAIPFVKLSFLLLMVFGKAGVMCFLGKTLLRGFGTETMKHPALPLLIGAMLLTLVYMVPVLGLITYGVATCIGIGAAVLALVNSFSSGELAPGSTPLPVNITSGQVVTGTPAPSTGMVATAPTLEQAGVPPQTTTAPTDIFLLQRAGFWKRFLAALLDLVLLSMTIPIIGPFFFLVAVIYFVGMWTWKGTTIGMIVLGLKLVRLDGKPLSFAVALVRSLSSFFSGLVLFLGFLWAGWDKDKQSWHDKIAGTVIVRMPKGVALI
jgi:uncharacterized RDD family membrane protein YckC